MVRRKFNQNFNFVQILSQFLMYYKYTYKLLFYSSDQN